MMGTFVDDPKILRGLLRVHGVVPPYKTLSFRMGLKSALAPSNKHQKQHILKLHRILNNRSMLGSIASTIAANDRWLPRLGPTSDLYFDIFESIADCLCLLPGYFGCEQFCAGTMVREQKLRNWVDGFNYHILSENLPPKVEEEFVVATIKIGKELLSKNIMLNSSLGPVVELFFEDRQLEIPKTLGELEAMEVDAPISLIQILSLIHI